MRTDDDRCSRSARFRYYSKPPPRANITSHPDITIIRPVKGPETFLYACLASSFQQVYPKGRIHVRFCVSSRDDPSLPVLEQLLRDFPEYDAKILVEDENNALRPEQLALGPNPKIRNMSQAYRQAREMSDIVWIIDCNVWVGRYTLERMVELLQTNKFVHVLPLAVETTPTAANQDRSSFFGGRLEELFLSSSHAKFYTAINTVLLAPCIVGKSTMFRISHLDSLTRGQGIDYFSENICEDHLIGDLLWKGKVRDETQGRKLGKHAMCFGDLAVQPVSGMSVRDYWERRVRWLRVRKFTVTLATLVEPGTESFLCSAYGAFAVTTLSFFRESLGVPPTWSVFAVFWLLSVSIWCVMDWTLYRKLHSGNSVRTDSNTPTFAQPIRGGKRRSFKDWLLAWLGREAFALPIWLFAFWGGTRVEWRGKRFWVGTDMKVHEIHGDGEATKVMLSNGHAGRKDR